MTSLPNGVDLSSQEDPVYYGFVISTLLTGITIVQAWIYINNNADSWAFRMLVAGLFILDLATLVLNVVFIHHDYIANFGNLSTINKIPPMILIEILLTTVIAFIMQMFFASRIYILRSVHYWVPLIVALTSTGALVLGIAGVVNAFRHPVEEAIDSTEFKIEIGLSSALSLLCDLVATIALLWSFRVFRTGFRRTDTMLQKLIEYTVTRGALVTVVQICIIISYLARPDRFIWLAFHMAEGKIYVITMIAMLNSRTTLRQGSVVSANTTFPSSRGHSSAVYPVFAEAAAANTDVQDSFELKSQSTQPPIREDNIILRPGASSRV